MVKTEEQKADFQAATHCYMCEELFYEKEEHWCKVRDHNHATGEYRRAAHFSCNLNKRRKTHIPVFFHNLRGYDSHLIMQGIHRYANKKRISVIPNNMEKYVSFSLGNLRFLDPSNSWDRVLVWMLWLEILQSSHISRNILKKCGVLTNLTMSIYYARKVSTLIPI